MVFELEIKTYVATFLSCQRVSLLSDNNNKGVFVQNLAW